MQQWHAISIGFFKVYPQLFVLVLFYQNVFNFSCWTNDDQQPSIQSDRHSWQCVIHGWGGNNPIRQKCTYYFHLSVLGELRKYTSYKYFYIFVSMTTYNYFSLQICDKQKVIVSLKMSQFLHLSVKIDWFWLYELKTYLFYVSTWWIILRKLISASE